MGVVPTARLIELVRAWNSHRVVEVPGPFSSSKTYTGLHVFSAWAMNRFEGGLFGLAAISDSQLQDVLLATLEDQWHPLGVRFRPRKHGWEFPSDIPGGRPNRFLRLLGGRRDAEDRLRGKNLQGLFVDEFPDFASAELVKLLMSRARLPGAKVMLTHNPEHIHHWSHTEILDRQPEGHLGRVPFTVYDNPKNDDAYIQSLLAMYPEGTAEYDRYVLGKPTRLSSNVFGGCEVAYLPERPLGVPDAYDITIDVGLSNYTHGLLIGMFGGRPVVLDEWRYSGNREGHMTGWEYVVAIFGRFARYPQFWERLRAVLVDPAAIDFRLEVEVFRQRLEAKHGHRFEHIRVDKPGKRKGRDVLRWWLVNLQATISPAVRELKKELSNLIWDPVAAAKGDDDPVKGPRHGIDALAYYIWNLHLAQHGRANETRIREMAGRAAPNDWRETSNRVLRGIRREATIGAMPYV